MLDVSGSPGSFLDVSSSTGDSLDVSGSFGSFLDVSGSSGVFLGLSGSFGCSLDVFGFSGDLLDVSGSFGSSLDVSGFLGHCVDVSGSSGSSLGMSGFSGGFLNVSGPFGSGFVALLLSPFAVGRCPVVCLYCFSVVLVFVLMLIVTSISLGWPGSVFGLSFAGFVGLNSWFCISSWFPCVAQRLAVPVPCLTCLSTSCDDLLSCPPLTSSVGSCGALCRGVVGVI